MALSKLFAAIAVGAALLAAALFFTAPAEASHNIYLPLVPNTPLMKQVIKTQEYKWCADARTSSYPNFISQLTDVTNEYTKRVGVRAQQVPFSDPSCMVKHTMPESFSCGTGAAACIYYANWPVTVEYKYTLGYTDWRSAQGHELGHGVLGLHEQYHDSGGVIQCTARQDTVMDCGSGVRYPTVLDVERACAIIQTAWCGNDGTAVCQSTGWDPCRQRWAFADGQSYDPVTGIWWNPLGQPEWTACNSDGLRWNFTVQAWFPPPSAFYIPSRGFWTSAGAC